MSIGVNHVPHYWSVWNFEWNSPGGLGVDHVHDLINHSTRINHVLYMWRIHDDSLCLACCVDPYCHKKKKVGSNAGLVQSWIHTGVPMTWLFIRKSGTNPNRTGYQQGPQIWLSIEDFELVIKITGFAIINLSSQPLSFLTDVDRYTNPSQCLETPNQLEKRTHQSHNNLAEW